MTSCYLCSWHDPRDQVEPALVATGRNGAKLYVVNNLLELVKDEGILLDVTIFWCPQDRRTGALVTGSSIFSIEALSLLVFDDLTPA